MKNMKKLIVFPAALAVTMSMGFSAMAAEAAADAALIEINEAGEATLDGMEDGLCSLGACGKDAETLAGDDYAITPVVYIENGTYNAEKSLAGENEAITAEAMDAVDIQINAEAVTGVVIKDTAYTISNSVISENAAETDGSLTCDFTGKGTALTVYGSESDVVIENTELIADGVAAMAVFCDNGASVLAKNSYLYSNGGTLYADYVNSPSMETMVAPPWILGIMGTSRCTNLMGTDSTFTVIDSYTGSANWAVLSTDAGSNMHLNVVNSSLNLTGSEDPMQIDGKFDNGNPYTNAAGYGTYVIGSAVETFLGVEFNVGTMASIFTGGTGYYGNLVAGETYDLLKADGSVHYSYTAAEDVQTVINSDTFGIMAHQNANTAVIDGAQINSAFSAIIVKSGCSIDVTIENGAQINPGNGILLQLFDNDDSTTEFAGAFGETHEEYAGFPTEAIAVEEDSADEAPAAEGESEGAEAPEGESAEEAAPEAAPEGDAEGASAEGESAGESAGGSGGTAEPTTSTYTVIDTALEGAIFNGIGWLANDFSQGAVVPMTLEVYLQGTATLNGQIASTSCIHATYDGQNYLKDQDIQAFDNAEDAAAFAAEYQAVSFTQAEYYNINQVANYICYNGLNDIFVTVADDAVWTVTDTSLIQGLTIEGNGSVVVEEGVVLTIGDQIYEAGTYTAENF